MSDEGGGSVDSGDYGGGYDAGAVSDAGAVDAGAAVSAPESAPEAGASIEGDGSSVDGSGALSDAATAMSTMAEPDFASMSGVDPAAQAVLDSYVANGGDPSYAESIAADLADPSAMDRSTPEAAAMADMAESDPVAYAQLMTGSAATMTSGDEVQVPAETFEQVAESPRLSNEQKKKLMFHSALSEKLKDPDNHISQELRNSCVATTAESTLASMKPDDYARVATDLFEKGNARGPHGESLKLSDANRDYIEALNVSEEAKISLRMQAAFMDLANGEDDYDIASDSSLDALGRYQGLHYDDAVAFNRLNGLDTVSPAEMAAAGGPEAIADMLAERADAARAGGAPGVVVMLDVPGDHTHSHQAVVTHVDANGNIVVDDGSGPVAVYSPERFAAMVSQSEKDVGTMGAARSTVTAGARTR